MRLKVRRERGSAGLDDEWLMDGRQALKSVRSRTIYTVKGAEKANYPQQDRRSIRSVMGIGDATRCDGASVEVSLVKALESGSG